MNYQVKSDPVVHSRFRLSDISDTQNKVQPKDYSEVLEFIESQIGFATHRNREIINKMIKGDEAMIKKVKDHLLKEPLVRKN